ncbi:hypothetical protein ACWEVP_31780 [Amycolatopsis sp. NPDC003865]
MSFSMSASGPVHHVRQQLEAAEVHGDTSQADRARELIYAELDDFPERDGLGVQVSAYGHHDGNSRNLSITIQPQYLTVDR